MSLVTQLVGFGLRQVIGDSADDVVQVVGMIEQRFRDHSRTLPKALEQAHHRAWQALGVALAGDGFLDRVKVFFASGDDKGVREQVQLFLKSNALSFYGTPAEFRQACLNELKRLRKSGLLSMQGASSAEIARQAAGFRRHADPQGLIEESRRAVAGVADALADGYPNLSRLLRTPTPAGPPLLAAAFCYFFRREVETDNELAHGLFFDGLERLSASQAMAFGEIGKALTALGGQFDALFEQLGRIEAVVVETHGAVLDVQAELQRLGGLHLANTGEIRSLFEQVMSQLALLGIQRGEVRPGNSCSIRGEDERRAVKALLERFRRLPSEEQRQVPALLNGLGKLQVGAGDFAEAHRTFTTVVQAVAEPSGKAEALFNAYRAALEEKRWDTALTALREAASHDPQRFAPFPLHRYEPRRILGAGGFGTAVLCRDRHFDEDVVVKTLHGADLARGVDEVFREARILRRLSHPAIIGVRDCEYADPNHKARPYLVMDYFAGGTLQQFVDERGPLSLEQLLAVAAQVAEGMKAAHIKGVLHRDLKPANLLVRKEGNLWKVKIIDFGLALRQQTVERSKIRTGATHKSMLDSSVAGTLDYAPPEQLGKLPGVQPGPYSDSYAFARTCCYAMFKATELRRKQWDSLPGPLVDLLEECLDPDPRQRPNGFEQVITVLHECPQERQKALLRQQHEQPSTVWQYHPVPPAEPDPHPESDALERLTPEECRLLAARVRGKKHKHEGTNCDDWYVVATAGPWTIIAVSDGAESRKLSRVGARASCQEAVRLLFAGLGSHRLKPRTADFARKDDKHAAFLDPEVEFVQQRMHEAFQGAFAAVEKAYRDRADDPAYAKMLTRRLVVEDLSGTLLVAAHTSVCVQGREQSLVVSCQIGDGVVAGIDPNGAVVVLGTRDSADYSGETDFLTSRRQLDPANLQRKTCGFVGQLRALLVMSNGVADDYFPADPGMARLYADLVLNGIIPPARMVSEEALAEVSEHMAPNFDPSSLDKESEAVTANGPLRVMLRSAAIYASELGRDVGWVAGSPAFLAFGARNAPLTPISPQPAERLRFWLDAYEGRGSFEDRTLVVLHREGVY